MGITRAQVKAIHDGLDAAIEKYTTTQNYKINSSKCGYSENGILKFTITIGPNGVIGAYVDSKLQSHVYYGFFEGCQISVGGETYIVRDITSRGSLIVTKEGSNKRYRVPVRNRSRISLVSAPARPVVEKILD